VVDGIPTGNINDINPADIERIDVLKTLLPPPYSAQEALTAVVIVSTKKGTKGVAKISYDAYVGVVNAYHLPPIDERSPICRLCREFWNTQAAAAGQALP